MTFGGQLTFNTVIVSKCQEFDILSIIYQMSFFS
jgi:hypothetical protein